MEFQDMKQKQLSKQDKSNIGRWDSKIKGLCDKLNKNKSYYTTSSCAGRIVLIKSLGEKAENVFLFRTHNRINFKELKGALDNIDYKELVEFQQTPCILHVACASLKDAQELVDKSKLAGWKRSGIMATGKRFMVELHSTEKLEFPIMNKRIVLVDDDFLKLIIEIANDKMEKVWEKIKRLEKELQ